MIESRPNIKAWYDKIKQRPSYASLPSLEDIKQKQLNAA
jgi:glutathione S-transferase